VEAFQRKNPAGFYNKSLTKKAEEAYLVWLLSIVENSSIFFSANCLSDQKLVLHLHPQ
jgi:hypothetical protein